MLFVKSMPTMRLEDSSPAFASAAVTYIHYFIIRQKYSVFSICSCRTSINFKSIAVIVPLIWWTLTGFTWQLKHRYMMRKQESSSISLATSFSWSCLFNFYYMGSKSSTQNLKGQCFWVFIFLFMSLKFFISTQYWTFSSYLNSKHFLWRNKSSV